MVVIIVSSYISMFSYSLLGNESTLQVIHEYVAMTIRYNPRSGPNGIGTAQRVIFLKSHHCANSPAYSADVIVAYLPGSGKTDVIDGS
jgi:hypothetical protein